MNQSERGAGASDRFSVSFEGELVIVSNRLPVHRVKRDKTTRWETSPGGLVSALTPILQRQKSLWIGWAGTPGPPPAPFENNGIFNIPLKLSREEVHAFYEGFSNRTLWPLYHDAVQTPEYRRIWWKPYVEVNARFARAAADVAAKGAVVWVHDYHLQLVPAMLRELRPDVKIGFFLHIPFPPRELFAQLPWRRPILEGMLGADVVGFQSPVGASNFMQLARRYAEAAGAANPLRHHGRSVHVDAFPISIDFQYFETLASAPDVQARAALIADKIGKTRRLILGVDRLDYTKGIDKRLQSYRELLRRGEISPEDCVLAQVAVPSRERVEEYSRLKARIDRLVGDINGEFGKLDLTPVHYLHRRQPPRELAALYLAADVMLVTPLRDGMNLVAKEYVACRVKNDGALVLSEFTGAARQLRSALLVNPHDLDGLSASVLAALNMPAEEQRRRMKALRRGVRNDDVFKWSQTFLETLTS